MVEQQLTTNQQIQLMIKSRQFQETLAKIVAPQVSNLIEPTVKKINQIEEQVGELHNYVQDTNTWQRQQTNKQSELQNDMNIMMTGMQQLQATMQQMMQMQMEREGIGGTKRSAPNIPLMQDPMTSPTRKQRLQHPRPPEQLITQDSEMTSETSTISEMAHIPPQIHQSSQPTAAAKERKIAEEGGET